MFRRFVLFCIILCFIQCTERQYADIIVYGSIYTQDSTMTTVESMAVLGGKIVFAGEKAGAIQWKGSETELIDYGQASIFPGFIEGHGHFEGVGKSMIELNLLGTTSWEEIMEMVVEKVLSSPPGWIVGRGWHQDKWDSIPRHQLDGYPYHDELSRLTPDHPMLLIHASGHSLFANKKAMEEVGINGETQNPVGGRIVKDQNNLLIGVFEENAMQSFNRAYNEWQSELGAEEYLKRKLLILEKAQKECLSKGVTSFQDAGSSYETIMFYKKQAEEGRLKLRLWAMLRDSYVDMKSVIDEFPIPLTNDFFSCTALKSEIDGALGSYGAWLLKPYFDKPGFEGQNTTSIKELAQIADLCADHGMQLCVHAIGDRGNRVVLDMMEEKTKNLGDNHRWRIEHAQHLHPDDIPRFAQLNIIASMQSVHCTSDAPFVVKRLGKERAKNGAYVWKSLINSGAVVSNGTDAPVEDVNPLTNYYAAVTRSSVRDTSSFFAEQKLSRKEAFYSMTLAPAYAAFEEDIKGSLEVGKYADFIVLTHDILTCTEEEILETKVLNTYVGGVLRI